MKTNNVFNDLVNESIKASFEKEAKKINDNQDLTIRCVRKVFCRKYARQATKIANDVFIGPYKFIGDKKYDYAGQYDVLYFVDNKGLKIEINSLADFGDYIKNQTEF